MRKRCRSISRYLFAPGIVLCAAAMVLAGFGLFDSWLWRSHFVDATAGPKRPGLTMPDEAVLQRMKALVAPRLNAKYGRWGYKFVCYGRGPAGLWNFTVIPYGPWANQRYGYVLDVDDRGHVVMEAKVLPH